ncbi:MAG: DUF2721 domain-containing protein [Pseudomonadales bacterium]|nr:DUF2721 domain-containing protein [Pseudomonadales bacterium]
MDQTTAIEAIAGVIQLAVAPVFLLAGIAGMLNVLTSRLGRVVDRFRKIETKMVGEAHDEHVAVLQKETQGLWQRIQLINWAIRTFVLGALLISLVIVALFCGELVAIDLSTMIATFFVIAMCFIIVGLVLFLFEVSTATKHINSGISGILQE